MLSSARGLSLLQLNVVNTRGVTVKEDFVRSILMGQTSLAVLCVNGEAWKVRRYTLLS